MPFGDCNVIEHIIHRTKHYQLEPIICTSTDSSDDILAEIAQNERVKIFRGSMINKLKRWYDCCNHFNIKEFHTVDADDPFFDGELMKKSMDLLNQGYDVVCPITSAWELHKKLPQADFHIIPDAGHSMKEEGIAKKLVEYTDRYLAL